MPKDHIQRRKISQRITNVMMIAGLSLGAAWFITRQPDTPAFTGWEPRAQKATPAAKPGTPSVTQEGSTADYKLPDGPRVVQQSPETTLHDFGRNRDVRVRAFYPEEHGRYPVILFTAGEDAGGKCCEALLHHWSSYGYIAVELLEKGALTTEQPAELETIRLNRTDRAATPRHIPSAADLPTDISFVIDSFPELQERVPGLKRRIDWDHIGAAGYGTGSFAAEAIGGAFLDLPGEGRKNVADPRVRAVLCISPQGPGQFGLTDSSFGRFVLPYLGITGSLDNRGPAGNAAWHRTAFERSEAGDKYQMFVQGANPASELAANMETKAAEGTKSETQGKALRYTNSAALAFWDAYLSHDAFARNYLQSGSLAKASQGVVKIERR